MGAAYPLAVLVRRQPAVTSSFRQERDYPVAVMVGGTKIARPRAVCHSPKILQPQVTGGSGNGPET